MLLFSNHSAAYQLKTSAADVAAMLPHSRTVQLAYFKHAVILHHIISYLYKKYTPIGQFESGFLHPTHYSYKSPQCQINHRHRKYAVIITPEHFG